MKRNAHGFGAPLLLFLTVAPLPAMAIEIQPTQEQIRAALDRGNEAAQQHSPPDALYLRFGALDDLHPNGFLITKLGALSVLAAHTALRGAQPTESEIAQILDAKTLLVSAMIYGDDPSLAADSYMVLDQGGHTVKPVTVRFDGQGKRSAAWPDSPRFKAKIVASFSYADFDPKAATTLAVFPAKGGEVSFSLDFAQIP